MINEDLQYTDYDDDGIEMNDEKMALFVKKLIKFLKNRKGNSSSRDRERNRNYRNDASKV